MNEMPSIIHSKRMLTILWLVIGVAEFEIGSEVLLWRDGWIHACLQRDKACCPV